MSQRQSSTFFLGGGVCGESYFDIMQIHKHSLSLSTHTLAYFVFTFAFVLAHIPSLLFCPLPSFCRDSFTCLFSISIQIAVVLYW